MKKLLMTIVLFASFVLTAQTVVAMEAPKPNYEIEDGFVKVTHYFVSGEIREQGYYDADNKLTGKWIQFDKTGKKTMIASYYKGAKVGKWFVLQGEKWLQLDYEQSRVANVSEWKKN